jgi:hypothetical protein
MDMNRELNEIIELLKAKNKRIILLGSLLIELN